MAAAQEPLKVPDSVAALAKKYDETRKKTLDPILESFAAEVKQKTVPALTRGGKADLAVKIDQAAETLKKSPVPLLPGSGAPFPAEVFPALQASPEWLIFSEKFVKAETALNETYKKALERERALFQSKGDPHGMVAVDNEIKRVNALKPGAAAVSPAAATAAASPPPATPAAETAASKDARAKTVSAADKRRIESWIVGTTWAAVTEEDQLLYFAKNGKGARRLRGEVTNVLEWRMEDDGTVTVSRAGWGKRITFFSATEAEAEYTSGHPGEKIKLQLSKEVIEGTK